MTWMPPAKWTTCPYVNVHQSCSVSSPIELLPDTPWHKRCHHIEGHFCSDYSRFAHYAKQEVEAFKDAVSD